MNARRFVGSLQRRRPPAGVSWQVVYRGGRAGKSAHNGWGIAEENDGLELRAHYERPQPEVGDAAWNRQVGQSGARAKRPNPDMDDATAEFDASQAVAFIERITPDVRDAVGDRHAGQTRHRLKCIVPDVHDYESVGFAGDHDGSS